MKVIVTGGVGFVGTNLIKKLLKDGNEVVSLDNYSTGKKKNHIFSSRVKYPLNSIPRVKGVASIK